MQELWRIGNRQTLSGEGGLRYAARWHSAGRPIVYLAESPAGALIEVLVHLELDAAELPAGYALLRVTLPAALQVDGIELPPGEAWRDDLRLTRRLGDAWLAGGSSALARVPSVILLSTFNVLLNPLHLEARQVSLVEGMPMAFDHRLAGVYRIATPSGTRAQHEKTVQ